MTQLIVNVEDVSLLSELKHAIMMLRGVSSITEKSDVESSLNPVTQQAIEDARSGNTLKCNSFEEYLELVK